MIRIDEIYNNIFWPWISKHMPGHRMFFCDPPGSTMPQSLLNYGCDDIEENAFVFLHDQEPVDLTLYKNLFDTVYVRCEDIICRQNLDHQGQPLGSFKDSIKDIMHMKKGCNLRFPNGHVIVSEKGHNVSQLCEHYDLTSHYYFFHGWACLDWFRGYDKTFLIARAKHRSPSKTFLSPNRIVGGQRDHRVLFLYHVFKQALAHNYISAPKVCVYENQDISVIAKKYCNRYADIEQVLAQAQLPRLFQGEPSQQMTSCWLTNFQESSDSLIYVPTETVYFGNRLHITEKTFKAIALEMPFVLVAAAGSLDYLKHYGFKTFDSVWNESYDCERDDFVRLEKIVALLKDIDSVSHKEKLQIHRACLPMVEHNYNHFYHGGLANVLWQEFEAMLNGLRI